MPELNPHALFTLLLAAAALVLFARDKLPIETSALTVLVMLVLTFALFPYDGEHGTLHAEELFFGFGHEALIAVTALMIAGQGLVRTGALEPLGRGLARLWAVSPSFSLLLTLLLGAALSAFVNNTPVVVLLLPILVGVSLRSGQRASSILMPMGFATLLGGMATTIGTSTNLLVVGVAADLGLPRMGMFDFFLPAVIAGSVAVVYLWLIAPRILPHREPPLADASIRIFSAELSVPEDSFAAAKTVRELHERTGNEMHIVRINRGDGVVLVPLPDVMVQAGDRLLLRDTPERLKTYERELGVQLHSGSERLDEMQKDALNSDQQMAEVAIALGSPLIGVSLRQARFADHYQLATVAIHRQGRPLQTSRRKVNDILLRAGDVLLVQGEIEHIGELKRGNELMVLDATADLPTSRQAPIATIIMLGIVSAAAFGVLPIAVSAIFGVLLMLMTRCMTWRDATRAMSPAVILLIAASLALGVAMQRTGGTDWLAEVFLGGFGTASPSVILSALMLLMAVVTNVVSNNAAAVIGTPVAVAIAQAKGLPAEPFVLAVLFGANMSFATPIAYKTNLLVMSAGGYRFSDFVRVGVPLTLLMWATFSVLLPWLYFT